MDGLLPWPVTVSFALFRILLALALLGVLLPSVLFAGLADPESSPWLSRAIWMVFVATVLVHLLTALHLYEGVVFLVLCLLASLWLRVGTLSAQERTALRVRTLGSLLDWMDRARPTALPWLTRTLPSPGGGRRPSWYRLATGLLLLIVLAMAARLLFAEVFTTPAPPFSDATVNIKWLKELHNGVLYGDDGVYPRGMYAWLSLVLKFTVLNAVVLLDVSGPLIGLGILLSLLFFVYKATRSPGATLVAAVMYGTLPHLLPMEFSRHAAPNSQEYGLMFVLPATWFTYAYLVGGRRADRATAAAAAGVMAFTHPIPTLFALVAMGVTAATALVQYGQTVWRRLPSLILWVGAAGLLAVLPLGLAFALGQHWHGTSLAYLNDVVSSLPPLNLMHVGVFLLAVVSVLLLLRFTRRSTGTAEFGPHAALAAVAAVGLLIYLLPALGVRSQALADRSVDMGAVGLTLSAALAWSLLERLLVRLQPLAPVVAGVVAIASWYLLPQAPARPYHYYSAEMIKAHLWADATYAPGTWTLVSSFLGYPLAIGRSLHLYPPWFLGMAQQMPADIHEWFTAEYASVDTTTQVTTKTHDHTEHYLLLVEKAPPQGAGVPGEGLAASVVPDAMQLGQWIDQAKDKLPLHQVFADDTLEVWTLDLPLPKVSDPLLSPAAPGSDRR